jgi:hypothetical protein
MLRCIKVIEEQLPEIAFHGLVSSKKYWLEQSLDEEQLTEARVKLWKFLDEQNLSTKFSSKDVCAIRSVICLLYEENELNSNDELLEFFFSMLSKVETNTRLLVDQLEVLIKPKH